MAGRTISLSATAETRSGEAPREIGRLLREARESRGEDLADAAAELYIQPAYLEAFELGEFERIPVGVYHVGLLRSYAKHLGLDGKALAERLVAPTDFRAGSGDQPSNGSGAAGQYRSYVKVAALVLLAAGLGAASYYAVWRATREVDQPQVADQAETPLPAAVPAAGEKDAETEPLATSDPRPASTGRETDPVAVASADGRDPSQQPAPEADTPASAPAVLEEVPTPEVMQSESTFSENSTLVTPEGPSAPEPSEAASVPLEEMVAAPETNNEEPPSPLAMPAQELASLEPTLEDQSKAASGEPAMPSPPAADVRPPSAAVTPAPAAKPPAPAELASPRAQFAIHVASVRALAEVAGEWRRLARRYPSLAGLEPGTPEPVDIPGKGTFYRVIGGAFATRAEAQAACKRLEAEGRDCRPVQR